MKNASGSMLALFSAFLFGISPVLLKFFSGEIPPIVMAGLLYLGSGTGLLMMRVIQHESVWRSVKATPRRQKLKLLGSIASGGIIAPICLTYGIFYSSAFQVSALLNLETVTTTILAWLIFHEHVGKRVWFGETLIVMGAFFITMTWKLDISFSFSSFFIIAACVFWSIDTNLTRDIEDLPPSLLAGVKGVSAGLFNILFALILNQTSNHIGAIAGILMIGFLSYGLSLVLFIDALRKIGSARTSAYFASGPFIGMIAAVVLLGEQALLSQWIAASVMLMGIYILYRENHMHLHTHELQTHRHLHVHDEHHQHEHNEAESPEPHEHMHRHQPLTHTHGHLPDIHHRHRHKKQCKKDSS